MGSDTSVDRGLVMVDKLILFSKLNDFVNMSDLRVKDEEELEDGDFILMSTVTNDAKMSDLVMLPYANIGDEGAPTTAVFSHVADVVYMSNLYLAPINIHQDYSFVFRIQANHIGIKMKADGMIEVAKINVSNTPYLTYAFDAFDFQGHRVVISSQQVYESERDKDTFDINVLKTTSSSQYIPVIENDKLRCLWAGNGYVVLTDIIEVDSVLVVDCNIDYVCDFSLDGIYRLYDDLMTPIVQFTNNNNFFFAVDFNTCTVWANGLKQWSKQTFNLNEEGTAPISVDDRFPDLVSTLPINDNISVDILCGAAGGTYTANYNLFTYTESQNYEESDDLWHYSTPPMGDPPQDAECIGVINTDITTKDVSQQINSVFGHTLESKYIDSARYRFIQHNIISTVGYVRYDAFEEGFDESSTDMFSQRVDIGVYIPRVEAGIIWEASGISTIVIGGRTLPQEGCPGHGNILISPCALTVVDVSDRVLTSPISDGEITGNYNFDVDDVLSTSTADIPADYLYCPEIVTRAAVQKGVEDSYGDFDYEYYTSTVFDKKVTVVLDPIYGELQFEDCDMGTMRKLDNRFYNGIIPDDNGVFYTYLQSSDNVRKVYYNNKDITENMQTAFNELGLKLELNLDLDNVTAAYML